MESISVVNISNEVNNRPSRPRAPKRARVAWDKYKRGTKKATGRPMFDAIALQPPPPCDHPDLGRCPFYSRCAATGEICFAFTKYAHSKKYTVSERVPNRHFDDFDQTDDLGGLDQSETGCILPTRGRATVHTGGLEAPEPAQPGPDERSPPQAGSTVHTDTHTHFIEN